MGHQPTTRGPLDRLLAAIERGGNALPHPATLFAIMAALVVVVSAVAVRFELRAIHQAAYRIGDSTTNIISPMMSYFALIIAFMQRYRDGAGLGTLVATMLPYSVTFIAGWTLLFVVWVLLGLPVGPGAPLYLRGR